MLRRLGRFISNPTLLDPTLYYENRCEAVRKYPGAYPNVYKTTHTLQEFRTQFAHFQRGEKGTQEVHVAGRILTMRFHGKLTFYTVYSHNTELQVFLDPSQYQGSNLSHLTSTLRRGDIIGIQGYPTRTAPRNTQLPGEISIVPKEMTLLSPCLHMLPGHSGLKDPETRYRKRYLDLLFNPSSRHIFHTRNQILTFIRNFLSSKGFFEVETPMMNLIPGGAAAKPFSTHLNELNLDLFMRIAPELYLKTLLIGGYEKVFELGKQFRNEGIDVTHNPEFTTCEAYCTYADYEDWMSMTEEMLSSIVKSVNNNSYKLPFHLHGKEKDPVELDFAPPFRRIEYIPALEKALEVKFPADLESKETEEMVEGLCRKHNVVMTGRNVGKWMDKLMDVLVLGKCVQPTFIINHPQFLSPLAKPHRSLASVSERFELIVACTELCNAYTELNDPFLQKRQFLAQMKLRDSGDDEALFLDQGYIEALEHALPPTAGWGMGVDRLVMLLTDQQSIKEVLLFPLMKPN